MNKHFVYAFILSTTSLLAATHTERQEESVFILKIVAIVVILLVLMPILLKKLKSKETFGEEFEVGLESPEETQEAGAPENDEVVEVAYEVQESQLIDPLDKALENLFNDRGIAVDEREFYRPTYKRYLEVKLGKVEIKTASFQFHELLELVTDRVHTLQDKRNFELVFEQDANVPSQLIGDIEHLSDMFFFLLQNVVYMCDNYPLQMQIKRVDREDDAVHLSFYIPYSKDNYEDDHFDIFTPFAASTALYGLELYLAREYARLMHGDLNFIKVNEDDSAFEVELKLFTPNPADMRFYRLPSKELMRKKVLIADDLRESAVAVEKMFLYFKNSVELISAKELITSLEVMEDFDIVVIQERYISHNVIKKIQELKEQGDIKLVSLNKNETFRHTIQETLSTVDSCLVKPVSNQKILDLLTFLYPNSVPDDET